MSSPHLLLIDDDREIRDLLSRFLERHGFRVTAVRDSREARRVWPTGHYNLVVLDLMLPGEGGLDLTRWLRSQSDVPVVMLTAMGEETDRIIGLELGADDYVVKPVPPRELLARVRALIRRRSQEGAPAQRAAAYAFGGFRFDIVRRQLKAPDGDVIMLTPGELSLLGAFVENPGRVLSRDELLHLTRGEDAAPVDRAIDIQISRLRRKLNGKSRDEVIKTHRGLGYLLDAKVSRS